MFVLYYAWLQFTQNQGENNKIIHIFLIPLHLCSTAFTPSSIHHGLVPWNIPLFKTLQHISYSEPFLLTRCNKHAVAQQWSNNETCMHEDDFVIVYYVFIPKLITKTNSKNQFYLNWKSWSCSTMHDSDLLNIRVRTTKLYRSIFVHVTFL